tara:strand:+ start:606 stop:737 length:132 start_codon:yes stop_codon:yes gene_type:complete
MRFLPGEHVSSTGTVAEAVEDYYSRLPVAETQAVIHIFYENKF